MSFTLFLFNIKDSIFINTMSYFLKFKPNVFHFAILGYSWGALGCVRGGQLHNHKCKNKDPYTYVASKPIYCIEGMALYINPFFLPFTVKKEMIRIVRYVNNEEPDYELL